MLLAIKRLETEMSVVRTQGSCVAIRALSPSSSINRCAHGSSGARAIEIDGLDYLVDGPHHFGSDMIGCNVCSFAIKKCYRENSGLLILAMKCFGVVLVPDDATCGTPTWIGKGLTCVCFKRKGTYERICINLTPQQEERFKRLKHRMKVYFDASRPDHQEALRALWSATYPDQELQGLISDQWKEMGWQGKDPSTDFRGAGFISLENLLFFAKTFSISFQRLLRKQGGKRAAWEYPFAVAGVNITFMIMQMLDLEATKPRTFVRSVFLQMLSDNEWAFDLLYCVAFVVMDKQWLERNATYMEFNDVLKSTRAQLERELLMDDVLRIEDMPSYGLLS